MYVWAERYALHSTESSVAAPLSTAAGGKGRGGSGSGSDENETDPIFYLGWGRGRGSGGSYPGTLGGTTTHHVKIEKPALMRLQSHGTKGFNVFCKNSIVLFQETR